MKKTRSKEQGPRDFTNRPFAGLKKAPPSPATPGTTKPRPAPARAGSADDVAVREDDETLFLRAAAGARRIGTHPVPSRPESSHPDPSRQSEDEQQRLFLAAMEKLGTASLTSFTKAEPVEPKGCGPSNRMKLLKRGTIRISEELDLHGYLRDEALRRLEHFITGAHHRGRTAVLVITGKGINSPEGPVLQGAVADWLRDKGRTLVAEFEKAPRDKGGSGAFVVFLRSPER